jgi:hypothetical protein
VILEGLTALHAVVATTEQPRGEACHGAECEYEYQCSASHPGLLFQPASTKRSEAAAERPGLDDVRQDFALPLIQRFVNLGESLERALANAIDDLVVSVEHALDVCAIEDLGANGARYVAARATKVAFRFMNRVHQVVDRFANYFFLAWGRVESVHQVIQKKASPTTAKTARSAAAITAGMMAVMATRDRRRQTQ